MKLLASASAVFISILSIAVQGQTRHEFFPKHHSRVFSAFKEPVRRINSGDTVFTRTWDSGGRDHEGVWHIQHPYVYPESGNPLTGPFYIEGADYGDLPIRPMLGCIGVAPAGERVETSGPSGVHGGNMDYNDVVEGARLYFPVFHQGAFLYVGDGHALQADGEGLGMGVETSMDVEFTVRVHKGKRIDLPRLENADYIVSIANGTNFDRSLRSANSDMIRWLMSDHGLTEPEAHLLMGSVAQHKIVLYSGSVATMIPKKFLARR